MRMLLGIAGLMLLWFFCGTSSAQPKDVAPPKVGLPRTVIGRGETIDNAKTDAIRQAVDQVLILMKRNEPELKSFKVSEEFVRERLLLDTGGPGKDFQVDNIGDPFKSWILTFRTDTDWWQEIVRRDREAERALHAEARQALGICVILGLSALLLAGFSYVRLDEYTHRRYTTWLRIAGLGVATGISAGWLWMVRA